MGDWYQAELYAAFTKITGEMELNDPERWTERVNRLGDFLHLSHARSEPIAVEHPVLSRAAGSVTVAKGSIVLICPTATDSGGSRALWREKVRHQASITTGAFSMVGDVHLLPGLTLEAHLDRFPGEFIPLTSLSALWVVPSRGGIHTLQCPLALLNPRAIVSFALDRR